MKKPLDTPILTTLLPQNPNQALSIPEIDKFKDLIRKSMPEFVAEIETKEDMGNAVYAASQEMLLVIEDCLIRYHGWNEQQLKTLHQQLRDVLTGVKEFEKNGLSILTPHSVDIVGEKVQEVGITGLLQEIASVRFHKERLGRIDMDMPVLDGATPFLKKLKERNRGK